MPFGLKNAGACFLKVMDDALACHSNAKCYIDDIFIYSRSFKDHIAHIRHVFESGSAVGLKVHSSKCVFDAHQVPYLGHILSAKGVSLMTAKVHAHLASERCFPENRQHWQCHSLLTAC